MAVGQGSLNSPLSYVAIGRETTLGTYTTCTAAIDFLTASLKTTQEKKILEELTRKRFNSKIINMGKKIEGDLEFYFYPEVASCNYILQNAMGGSITTSVLSAGSSYLHQIDTGVMGLTYSSLCLNQRKGDAAGAMIYEYKGARVNELVLSAELDDALKCKASVIAFDSTMNANDVESALTATCTDALDFINGRFSVETTFASLTSSSFWHIQSFELTLNNSLKADNESRRIGSDILGVLPVGMGSVEMTATVRFDTTTAFDAMIAKTQFSAELEFLGNSITGSETRRGLKIQLPKVYIADAGDPEIGGPDEILQSEITFSILNDCSSTTGFAIRSLVTNGVADYD